MPGRMMTVTLAVLLSGSSVRAGEWNRFRGENGSGVSAATTVPVRWTADDFNWRVELPGTGHASPVAWKKQLFLLSGDEESGNRIASCIHSESGDLVWTRTFEASSHRRHRLNSLASSTPAVDDHGVYLCWATPDECIITAVDHEGVPQWRVDLGGFRSGHGFGISPIVADNLVIVAKEHEGDSIVVALDRTTGNQQWKIDRNTRTTWSTPCLYAPAGREAELILTDWEHGVTAFDVRTGAARWELSVFDQEHSESSISSPVVSGNLIYGTCGYLGYATHTVAVRPDNGKTATVEEVFRVDRGAPLTTTPLIADGLLVLWADNGIVTCVDATTGREHWRKRVGGTYYSSPVAIGKAVYCASVSGEMVVLDLSREFRELSRSPLLEASHSSPAVVDGRLFIRTFSHLISIGGAASGS